MDSRVLEEAARTWREEGWVLIPSLIPEAEIDAAVKDLWITYPPPEVFHSDAPSRRRDLFHSYRDPTPAFYRSPAEGPAFRCRTRRLNSMPRRFRRQVPEAPISLTGLMSGIAGQT